jgi:hypothetical protein
MRITLKLAKLSVRLAGGPGKSKKSREDRKALKKIFSSYIAGNVRGELEIRPA